MQKKRIMISALALVVVALVASWGVNAYFNDTEGTPANSVTAGTLDLVLTPGGSSTLPFVATPVYPGFTNNATPVQMVLTNAGNINGNLSMAVTVITTNGNLPDTEPEAADTENAGAVGDLQEVLKVKFYDVTNSKLIYEGLLKDFSSSWGTVGLAKNSGSVTVNMYVWVPASADNEIQGDSLTFDITFTLIQNVHGELV